MPAEKYQTARCYVHQGMPVDTRLLHEHHKRPQGYGGEKDDPENLVWLCGSCHDLVHRLAHFMRGRKKGLVSDLAQQYQASQNLSPAGKQRLLELANLVATTIDSFIPEDMEELVEEDTVLVQVPLPRSVHKMLKHLAAQHKNPGSKRQLGMYKYLQILITNHVKLATSSRMHAKDPEKYFGVDIDCTETPTLAKDMGDLIPFE